MPALPALPARQISSLFKPDPDARFVHQTVTRVGHLDADPKVPDDVIRARSPPWKN
jgi:hypothetical protein